MDFPLIYFSIGACFKITFMMIRIYVTFHNALSLAFLAVIYLSFATY